MKNYGLLLVCCLIISCNSGNNKKTKEDLATAAASIKKLLGSFVGLFGDNKITLLITKVQDGIVEGRSIVGGNDRTFTGTLQEKEEMYTIAAKEPGDDPNDGNFEFSISKNNPDVLTGWWKSNNPAKASKNYTLNRRAFVYRTDVGFYPEASVRELKEEDLENMIKPDLELMRNEIFARHGYCFRKKEMREVFEDEDWYIPDNIDVRDKLTPLEVKNLALIKRYEKYAEDYGDDYGR